MDSKITKILLLTLFLSVAVIGGYYIWLNVFNDGEINGSNSDQAGTEVINENNYEQETDNDSNIEYIGGEEYEGAEITTIGNEEGNSGKSCIVTGVVIPDGKTFEQQGENCICMDGEVNCTN